MNTEGSSQPGRAVGGSASKQGSVDRNGSAQPVDVVLATHDDSVRSVLRSRLEEHGGFVITAEKTNATQALGAALFHSPRICLLGVDLPGDLVTRIAAMRAERPDTRIGILARSADQPGLLRAVLAGADGVLLISDPPQRFIAELGALARGERVLPPDGNDASPPDANLAHPPDANEARGADATSEPRSEVAMPVSEPGLSLGTDSSRPAPLIVPPAHRDGRLKATVLYLPRFAHHLRGRLRARMPLSIAWSSARQRMGDYR